MKRVAVVVLALGSASGCAVAHDVGAASGQAGLYGPVALDARCRSEIADAPFDLPEHLSCTGLYADMDAEKREVAEQVMSFAPAYLLWSDGLDKSRWLFLPEDAQIDATNASAWTFPVGTRVWKEFRAPGSEQRIETRLYFKKGEGEWRQTSYAWDASMSDATRVDRAKDVDVGDGQLHWIPGPSDCDECHKGRRDRVLGFEQVSLGLPEASGETLAQLAAAGRLKGFDESAPTTYQIGPGEDDGTEARALGWMHINCGVTCHNDGSNATGGSVSLRLRLDPTQLDGREVTDFATFKTTVGVATQALQWTGNTRITPGSSENSWLYTLITQRGEDRQMPPIGSNVVDEEDSAVVKKWIDSLPASASAP
ncbi:MAG: hypothetical protein ABW321_10950 [Polyangiales bacterium]